MLVERRGRTVVMSSWAKEITGLSEKNRPITGLYDLHVLEATVSQSEAGSLAIAAG